ncbi:MAG: hypothetical protein E6J90_35120 [Deltaproteobacteria bacterium]|nr:MAG: hypothetical protein E6J90_35120 [Deltaproteobacteria bacterium]TMQ18874.1 MAG: hypothetical protein E6J91_07160 [Deltaproteobacteria bacterium]
MEPRGIVAAIMPNMGAAAVWAGVARAEDFFMERAPVHRALAKLAKALDDLEIPYALVGAMALHEYGFQRVTVGIDILMTADGLARFKAAWLGRGYVEKFPGSRAMRDTEHGVTIDVLLTGGYPGDGQPKPVRFPDPAIAIRDGGLSLIPLAKLVELKLASGVSNPNRLKDLSDILELIKHARLARELSEDLDPYVRKKYLELWDIAQVPDPISE